MEALPRSLMAVVLAGTLLSVVAGVPASADPVEQIVNGTFDSGHAPWWGTGNITLDSSGGQLCADIPGGTVNPWDVIIGQNDLSLVAGESYAFSMDLGPGAFGKAMVQLPVDPWTQYVSLPFPASEGGFTSPVSLDNAQVVFQIGGRAEPWRFCVDNVSLLGGAAPPVYTPDTGPRVRVNQVGYLASGPKKATLVTDSTSALSWELRSGGSAVASGQTVPRGVDATSGQNVHSIDFSSVTAAGSYVLVADGETSHPFNVDGGVYSQLRDDALKFYYTQRSGIEILPSLRPGYGRPAGHVGVAPNLGDISVPCQPGVCDYSLDVRGGWYDAGDHGKYVVNGGISVYQLMNAFERNRFAFPDGQLALPESGNGVPDILDEARWEMEFLLSMQVPADKPLAGMAHHKMHDNAWTGLPLLPHLDPRQRELHAPSTAATLNLAATAAVAARVFAPYDAAFAAGNLSVAKSAFSAALAHPALYAPGSDNIGGGAYDDTNVTDEFYWAAAALYVTTGSAVYRDHVLNSPLHTANVFTPSGFSWQAVGALGRLELAGTPNPLQASVKGSVVAAAQTYLQAQAAHAYELTYTAPNGLFDWGSNSSVLNNLVVIGAAYDLTGDAAFRDGVLSGMDYLLGRNALNMSYITGYGEQNAHNQHSRWYAHQLNPDLPNPPRGTLSGGPNSSIQDPIAQQKLQGCVGQFCFIDDIESWATNELTINWNAPLAWVSAFLASGSSASPCQASYTTLSAWPDGFLASVTVRNTSPSTLEGWTARFSFLSGQKVTAGYLATVTQSGAMVTATPEFWNKKLKPGESATFLFLGNPGSGPNPAPRVTCS
ncbi:glycoside hydrolase family 9 protein [Catelliglobosispora koreensis]|uniref:glycoside hydrolase family 9 protein n=1 Tax=Catelliglobosispora koreensis TaxID=129052 RepID=UPI00058EF746|nr:glycoside hydrolase family 9 protein [Catelliglobosispora koreensis]